MGDNTILTVPHHVPPDKIVEAVNRLPFCRGARFIETDLGAARSEDFSLHGRVPLMDTDGPAPREISFHHGRESREDDDGGTAPYTYITLGSRGNAERIICGLGADLGGVVHNEATGERWSFPVPPGKP